MTAIVIVGLFFPGAPMLVLGVVLARFEARQQYSGIQRQRWENQLAEAGNQKLLKIWKRQSKTRAVIEAAQTRDPQYQLNIWT